MTVGPRVDLRIQTRSLPFPPCASFFDKSAQSARVGLHYNADLLRRSGAPYAVAAPLWCRLEAISSADCLAIPGFVRSIQGFSLMAW
ncbi:hypothetical protein [Paraburkholderia sp. EG304]|uniref:hypothetical protein n=1 Tax=Paraburkholderia sp. EG304 TaxID=3237015 RepID=UPI00397D5364